MCNEKSKVHTPTEDNSFVRINGWTLPLNGLQILTWIVIVYCGFVFFAIEALSVDQLLYPATYICVGVFYVALIVCLLIATSINPADDNSLHRNNDQKPRPVFNRSLHKHVIEQGYCHICEVNVGGLSKHCSVCNKCVSVFDHHCKWLNNCVGDKNYRIFLLTLASAILVSVGMLALAVYALVISFNNFQDIEVWWTPRGDLTIAFQALIIIQGMILIAALILVTQLLCFHIMLIHRGMTTFEYIKRTTRLKRETRNQSVRNASTTASTSAVPPDNNNCTKNDNISFVSLHERSNTEPKSRKDGQTQEFINQGFTPDPSDPLRSDEVNSNNNASSDMHQAKDQALPHAIPDNLQQPKKVGEHRRRRRRRRKSQLETVDEAPPDRPLPLPNLHPLLESPSSTPRRNPHLPPIRDSVEWSSVEDLAKEVAKRGKLPPLSTRSSTTSLSSSVLSEV